MTSTPTYVTRPSLTKSLAGINKISTDQDDWGHDQLLLLLVYELSSPGPYKLRSASAWEALCPAMPFIVQVVTIHFWLPPAV